MSTTPTTPTTPDAPTAADPETTPRKREAELDPQTPEALHDLADKLKHAGLRVVYAVEPFDHLGPAACRSAFLRATYSTDDQRAAGRALMPGAEHQPEIAAFYAEYCVVVDG